MAEPADKPGPVVDSHSSRRIVTDTLKQPTRRHRGPRHRLPIWPCSRWGLPCRSVAGLAVRSYRTVSPLPRIPKDRSAVCSLLHFPSARAAQALPGTVPCGARTFLGTGSSARSDDATAWPTPPPALSHGPLPAPAGPIWSGSLDGQQPADTGCRVALGGHRKHVLYGVGSVDANRDEEQCRVPVFDERHHRRYARQRGQRLPERLVGRTDHPDGNPVPWFTRRRRTAPCAPRR